MPHRPDHEKHIVHASTRKGYPVQIRHVEQSDGPLFVDLYDHLSPKSLRLRFFQSTEHLPREYIEHKAQELATVDSTREVVLAAADPQRNGALLAVGRLSKVEDTDVAEMAVIVRDDFHGHG